MSILRYNQFIKENNQVDSDYFDWQTIIDCHQELIDEGALVEYRYRNMSQWNKPSGGFVTNKLNPNEISLPGERGINWEICGIDIYGKNIKTSDIDIMKKRCLGYVSNIRYKTNMVKFHNVVVAISIYLESQITDIEDWEYNETH
jgi:hypothetical protein